MALHPLALRFGIAERLLRARHVREDRRDLLAEGKEAHRELVWMPDLREPEVRCADGLARRVAIEAESYGRHKSGRVYSNQYHFLMRLRDGKVTEWKEYMDTMHANDVLCGGGS